ncbi:MAG: hypothetical protein HQL76_03855 [Magnetococcales bacterium]|nr:hypothetical protein [Magnetococcales bacterium]
MKDLRQPLEFLYRAVPRLMGQMDRDPLSPTWGSMHLAYWRDKTSEISDMRRQEAMLPLALLYVREYPGSPWRGDPQLLATVAAQLGFWCANQYGDGSMDEWYKGERAFAAAAFSCHAVARTLAEVGGVLPPELVRHAREKLAATAHWLKGRQDLFKTNHQAVGVAALAWAGHVLDDAALTANARDKLQSILRTQTTEGWFPEVGHMDVGYTFLTVEFVAMAMDLWNDWSAIAPFVRAFEFACQWVHPDLTIGEEYGVCHNPYLSRIAVILLSPYSRQAAWLYHRFARMETGFKGFANTLGDDLRLPRWAFQTLLAHDYYQRRQTIAPPEGEAVPLARGASMEDPMAEPVLFKDSALIRFHVGAGSGIFAAVAGGVTRLFSPDTLGSVADFGYALDLDRGSATNMTYDRHLHFGVEQGQPFVLAPLPRVKKFIPSFMARLVLRLASSTALGSRLTRKGIDWIRRRKGSALNQSSANLGGRSAPWTLERRLKLSAGKVCIRDRLLFKTPLRGNRIHFLEARDHSFIEKRSIGENIVHLPQLLERLDLEKVYVLDGAWRLAEVRLVHAVAKEG